MQLYGIMNVLGKLKAKIIETDTLTTTTIAEFLTSKSYIRC